jgi:hypothetical protein
VKLFKCQNCAQLLYFENRQCQKCSHRLGYVPDAGALCALEQDGNVWRELTASNRRYRFCANAGYDACNWLLPADSPENLCAACRHNRTIPDLTVEENLTRWRKFEIAKHRLFYTLMRLRLPLASRAEDPKNGLAFDFVADTPDVQGGKVMTGHEKGLITINLKEADDAEREKLRAAMGEPYRTILGHFRHETGHYFWDRLVRDQGRLEAFRKFFGDERQDYKQALKMHYANGPDPGASDSYISSYASAHPWEDFAETWAHYLHIVDTLEMAFAFGLRIQPNIDRNSDLSAVLDFDPHESGDMDRLVQAWLPLTFAMNSLNRCMGGRDLYPFVLSPPVITKMGFIHELAHA